MRARLQVNAPTKCLSFGSGLSPVLLRGTGSGGDKKKAAQTSQRQSSADTRATTTTTTTRHETATRQDSRASEEVQWQIELAGGTRASLV